MSQNTANNNNHPIVAITPCPDYNPENVQRAVDQAVEHIGGWEQCAATGQHLLAKPNMLSDRKPEEGVTTHPAILDAVITRLKEVGANITIGDSPANAHRGVQSHWQKTGYSEVAKKHGIDLVSFEGNTAVEKTIRDQQYYVSRPVVECDAIINLPKFKTHNLTVMTGAVKNLFGILPGFRKSDLHRQFPKPDSFSQAVVDVYQIAPPRLNIMDAVIGMEGNGPAGAPLRNVGVILASFDAVALDVVAGVMMGLAPNQIPVTRIAGERNVGVVNPENITLKGAEWSDLPLPDFRLPDAHIVNRIPESISRLIAGLVWIQPRIDAKTCTSCQICIETCPVQCITLNRNSAVIEKKNCIQCYCCSEVCPENAVVMDRSLMARMMIR